MLAPVEAKLKPPPGPANARAWLITSSSSWPYSWITSLRMRIKFLFSVKDCGVGGIAVEVPIARRFNGGLVSKYVKMFCEGDEVSLKTF